MQTVGAGAGVGAGLVHLLCGTHVREQEIKIFALRYAARPYTAELISAPPLLRAILLRMLWCAVS